MPRPVGTTKPNTPKRGHPQDYLRPLPMRISQRSYDRLDALRAIDDQSIQEHVRRALDYYLDHVEVVLALAASEHLKQAIVVVKETHPDTPPEKIIPGLLAKHAPRPIRMAAPKVVSK